MDSKKELRNGIQHVVNSFFEKEITIEERLFQTLELTDSRDQVGAPSSLAILGAALRYQPAIAEVLSECGIKISIKEYPPLPKYSIDINAQSFDWFTQFETWFGPPYEYLVNFEISKSDNSFAINKVKASGKIGITDIINGCLQSRWLVNEVDFSPFDEPNDLVDFLAKQAIKSNYFEKNSHPNSYWDSINGFCQTIEAKLESLKIFDPDCGEQQFLLYNDGKKIRIRPFGLWGTYNFQDLPFNDGSLWIARTNVLQPVQYFCDESIELLEDLINSDAEEKEFQTFFESNPKLLLLIGDYKALHPQLVLHEDDGSRLIPDFFLENITSDFCDICDLKRPTAELIRSQSNRMRFRDAIQEGVAQLRTYRDYFEDKSNRLAFKDKYGLNAYRPKVVLIIGRKKSYYDDIQRIKLESDLPKWISLKTYDDIVYKARQWLSLAKIGAQ
jgi:hypothetical protein